MASKQSNDSDLCDPVRIDFDEEDGFLLVQLDPAEYGYIDQEVRYQGKNFAPKDELHITILSQDAAEIVAEHMQQGAEDSAAIHELIDSVRWSYRKQETYHHIKDGAEETIIQMVEMPELRSFFQELSRIVGKGLVLPPVHVTLYMLNSEKGIGLSSHEVLQRLSQGEIRREDFLPNNYDQQHNAE
jgi:hypothetical protein